MVVVAVEVTSPIYRTRSFKRQFFAEGLVPEPATRLIVLPVLGPSPGQPCALKLSTGMCSYSPASTSNGNVRPGVITTCSNSKCNNTPLESPVPSPHPRQGTLLQIRCFACQNLFSHAFYPGQVPSSSISNHKSNTASRSGLSPPPNVPSGSSQPRKGRKFGTQERPLETGYYDILGVPINVTSDSPQKI